MYDYECFDFFEDLIEYLNTNHIHKENIICVEKTKLYWLLIFYKGDDKNDKGMRLDNSIVGEHGCHDCEYHNTDECHVTRNKLCKDCDHSIGCARYHTN